MKKFITNLLNINRDKIDWKYVGKDFSYLARDEDGRSFLFASKPVIFDGMWISEEKTVEATNFYSYKKGSRSWRNSLIKRP